MALVTTPLLSFDASGEVGKAIVFSKWKGRNYVRKFVVPKNPHSLGQQFQRSYLAGLVAAWKGLMFTDTTLWTNYWADRAAADSISPFNAFMKWNLNRLSEGQVYGSDDAGHFIDNDAPICTITAVAHNPNAAQIHVVGDVSTSPGQMTIITIGTASGANTTSHSIQRTIFGGIFDADSTFTKTFHDLPAGAYFFGVATLRGAIEAPTWAHTSAAITLTN